MQKGSALIPLTLLLAVFSLAIFSGWYYLNNEKPSLQTSQVSDTPMPSKSPEKVQYNDSEVGFNVTIPEGYEVKEESEAEYFKRAYGDIRKNFTYYVQYSPAEFVNSYYFLKKGESDPENAALSIVVFQNPDNLTPEAFYNKYWYYPFVWGEFSQSEKSKIAPTNIELIAGKEAGTAVVSYRDSNPKFIYLPLGSKNLMFQLHLPTENNKAGEELYKSIILE